MRRTILGAATCCALMLGVMAPSTMADVERACVNGNVTWSVTATTVTKTQSEAHGCYRVTASAGLNGTYPEFDVDGKYQIYPGGSLTFSYTPINGNCNGLLSLETPTQSWRGVLRNDGNNHATVTLVMTPKTTSPAKSVQQAVGLSATPCSSSFTTSALVSSSTP